MPQEWIAALIVAVAGAYLLWRLLPGRWRQPLARMHPALARETGHCKGCGGCASVHNPPPCPHGQHNRQHN